MDSSISSTSSASYFSTTPTNATAPESLLFSERFGVIIIGVIILAGLLLLQAVARIRQRFVLINERKPHTIIGSDASKSMRQKIQKNLERSVQTFTEPLLLHDEQLPTKDHHYRMKVMDDVIALNDVFLEVDGHLLRPVGRDLREHLSLLRRVCPSVFEGKERLSDALSVMYEHARFVAKPFGRREYERFNLLLEALKKLVKRINQADVNVSSSELDISGQHAWTSQVTAAASSSAADDSGLPATKVINTTKGRKRLSFSFRNKSSSRGNIREEEGRSSPHATVVAVGSNEDPTFV